MGDKPKTINFYWDFFFKSDEQSAELTRIEFLKQMPFFKNLSARQIKSIGHLLHVRNYSEGEYLFEFGNPGAALFLIQSGRVEIVIPDNGEFVSVTEIEENAFLGELALLMNTDRTASARAMKPTTCLALYRNDLEALGEREPDIALEIYKALSNIVGRRLEATTKKINRLKDEQSANIKAA